MNYKTDKTKIMRVANFTGIDLPVEYRLDFDGGDIETIVKKLRYHADLPYAFVVDKKHSGQITEVLSELRAIRSPCYPYALFLLDGTGAGINDTDLDVFHINNTDPTVISNRIREYAAVKLTFNSQKLCVGCSNSIPEMVDVAIVGAGVTGLYAANRLQEAGISCCILEREAKVGGIWSKFANSTSQVNTSESAYRLVEKTARSNSDHSFTREVLADISQLAENVSDRLYLESEVRSIEKANDLYRIEWTRDGKSSVLQSKGVIMAINDRVGEPREANWNDQSSFKGNIVSGIYDDTNGLDWQDKNVVIVGMGAFAVENTRTALEGGARHVTVVCRRHGTICPKIIDYLNFATPYDEAFKHDKKSNIRNMMYWKKVYQLSGATQPECWMGKIKHDGHTISVSDIWFIGHYLNKITTITGEIAGMTENGVITNRQEHIEADIVVNCIGFERNTSVAKSLSGYRETFNNNYIDKDFMYLADAYIDADAFNALFGSSVLEMVKFYMEVFITFFDSPEYHTMIKTDGIEKLPIDERKWTDYIKGAMALIQKYPEIEKIARMLVDQRTRNFIEIHDLQTYIAQNKREWIHLHSMLAGRQMQADECLPYVFEKILPQTN